MNQLISSFEGGIVSYYDLFFGEKIEEEFNYIKEMINCVDDSILSKKKGKCLDVGCGTGAFAQKISFFFDKVTAVDISGDMLEYAQKYHRADNICYMHEDIRKFKTESQNDMAVALAHVIGYQLDNDSVEKMLINVNRSLKTNGLFLFNFYNEPALFQGKLEARYRKVQNHSTVVSRFSNASICAEDNVLLLDYYYIVESPGDSPDCFEIHEKMRYFTVKEMEYYLNKTGFKNIKTFRYGTRNMLSSKEWNAGMIVRKVYDI